MPLTSVTFSPNGRRLAVPTSFDHDVLLWDVPTREAG